MPQQPIKITKKKDRTLVSVTGPMTVVLARELKEGLLNAFGVGKEVELSLAGVTEVDLTGLQLLCSAHRTSLTKGVRFSVADEQPAALTETAQLAGMLRQQGCIQDVACSCVWRTDGRNGR